ncbi:unnamed protein product [Rotaria sp. Silwood2]|nr:unnamed protein product [Rotaria sp. Silwood2]CAF2572799.1 unnamed protein product [Rotaria sp. Silwood2]CAF2965732.1 unnamed protein product [Rotaria sp. Silwood2]CAF3888023.1 unnamed protein product [Rotaria sp. Silwood2]CAF4298057.1 unnamed protein product [Rotaria sp. Silwood2]
MAAAVSSYSPNLYHQQSYLNSTLSSFYAAQFIPNNYYRPKSQKQQEQQQKPRTPTPTKTTEKVDSNIQQLRPRREPRIRRQVIVLPTPEPIYRQVRHRLPTPERQVIQRTVIQKANGDVIVQQQRHRKNIRSHSLSGPITQIGTHRVPQVKID